MAVGPKKRFLFHAHTTALSGSLRRPFNEQIQTQAGSALSATGGVANGRVEKFRHRDLISCDAAYTTAVGHSDDETLTTPATHTTLVTATVEGLNVLNMVTADRVVTRIASVHNADGTSEPRILTVGSYIDNLKIAGQHVELHYDANYVTNWDTFKKAQEGTPAGPHKHEHLIHASIIRDLEAPDGLTLEDGNCIVFPEFGRIYLGELFIWPDRRKLSMMRLVLGCSHEGDVTICDGDGNGGTYPP
jgi:hypothetical protein